MTMRALPYVLTGFLFFTAGAVSIGVFDFRTSKTQFCVLVSVELIFCKILVKPKIIATFVAPM